MVPMTHARHLIRPNRETMGCPMPMDVYSFSRDVRFGTDDVGAALHVRDDTNTLVVAFDRGETTMSGRARALTTIVTVIACFLFVSSPIAAQAAGKLYRIGILSNAPKSYAPHAYNISQFRARLRSLGYVEGRNVEFLYRYPSSMAARPAELPVLARQLVALKPDVILTGGVPAAVVAQRVIRKIPVVVAVPAQVVIKDFRHPGGNITGLSSMAGDLLGKQLQIFREMIPSLKKVAVLWTPQNHSHPHEVERAKRSAKALGMTLFPVPARTPAAFAPAFEKMAKARADGVVILRDGLFLNSRPQISNLATRYGIPSMFGHPVEAEAGGLIAYGTPVASLWRGAAAYVAKILKGAKPSGLPVERPTRFDLIVNLKTAKALGVTIPPSILMRANKVIQ